MASKSGKKGQPAILKADAESFIPRMRELRDLIPQVVHANKHSPNSDLTNHLRESFYDAAQDVAECPLVLNGKKMTFLEGFKKIVDAGSRSADRFKDVENTPIASADLWTLPGFKEAGDIQIGSSEQLLKDVLPVFRFQLGQQISVNEPLGNGDDDPCYLHGSNDWWMWVVGAHFEARSWAKCNGVLTAYPKIKVEAYVWGTCSGTWFGPEKTKTNYNSSSAKVSWDVWGTVPLQLFSKHQLCVTSYSSGCVQLKLC